jgi:hypothetical protein
MRMLIGCNPEIAFSDAREPAEEISIERALQSLNKP